MPPSLSLLFLASAVAAPVQAGPHVARRHGEHRFTDLRFRLDGRSADRRIRIDDLRFRTGDRISTD